MSIIASQQRTGIAEPVSSVSSLQTPVASTAFVASPGSPPKINTDGPTPRDAPERPQNEGGSGDSDPSRVSRKTMVDWSTNELVYRVIDNRSGQVVSQTPDEALLRLRAYAKQVETQGKCESSSAQTEPRQA